MALVATTIVAAGVLGGFLLGRSTVPSKEARSSPTPATPTPSPTATPEPTHSPSPPKNDADFPGVARGDRFNLTVEAIKETTLSHIRPCIAHRFGGEIAHIEHCQGYESLDKKLILVAVKLTNTSGEPLNFDLESFLLSSQGGAVFDPVDVRADFNYDPFLLPRSGLIPPGKARDGWITFDGRLQFRVADSVAYADGNQVLTVHFSGKHTAGSV